VIDLTFSNIPFARTEVVNDMHTGSDQETVITTIQGRGNKPLNQFHYWVPDTELPRLAGLLGNQLAELPNPWELDTTD
jgi:hypothetical protein